MSTTTAFLPPPTNPPDPLDPLPGTATVVRTWADRVRAAVAPLPGGRFRRHRTGEVSPGTPELLRSWIYCDVHTGPASEHHAGGADPAVERRVVAALPAGTYPSPGWTVQDAGSDLGGGTVVVERDGVSLVLTPREVRPAEPTAGDPAVGDVTTVSLPRTRPRALPGWASFVAPTGPGSGAAARLYLHLQTLDVLPQLVCALDRAPVPWRAKVSTTPGPVSRPDAAVVYCAPDDLADLLGPLVPAVQGLLHDPVPGFSRRIAPGLAASVNPPEFGGGSFGAGTAHVAAQALLTGGDLTAALTRCCLPLPATRAPARLPWRHEVATFREEGR